MSSSLLLDAVEAQLCQPCKRDFQHDLGAQEMWADKIRLEAHERLLIAVITAGAYKPLDPGLPLVEQYGLQIDKIVEHQRGRKAFVFAWLSRPKPETESASESKETP